LEAVDQRGAVDAQAIPDGVQVAVGVEQVSGGEQFSRLADAQRSLAVYQGMGDPGMAGPSRETADLANLPDMVGSEGLPAALASDAVSRRLQSDPEIAKKIGQGLLAGLPGEATKGFLNFGASALYGPQALFGSKQAARDYRQAVKDVDATIEGQSRAGFEGGMLNNALKSASGEAIPMLFSMGTGLVAGGVRKLAQGATEAATKAFIESAATTPLKQAPALLKSLSGGLGKLIGTAELKSDAAKMISDRVLNAVAFLPSSMRGGLDNMATALDTADDLRRQGKTKEADAVEDNATSVMLAGTALETLSENMWVNEMMVTKAGRPFSEAITASLNRKLGPKMGKVADFFAKTLTGANQEGIEEIVSGVGNSAWMNAYAEQNKDVFGDIPSDYLGGAIMGGIMEGAKMLKGEKAQAFANATTQNLQHDPEAASTLAEIRAKAEEIAANPKPEVATPETPAEPISSAPPPAPGADATPQTSPEPSVPVAPAGPEPSPGLSIAPGADSAPVETPKAFAPIAPLPESKSADEVAKVLHEARADAVDAANEGMKVPGAEITAEAVASIAADEDVNAATGAVTAALLPSESRQLADFAKANSGMPVDQVKRNLINLGFMAKAATNELGFLADAISRSGESVAERANENASREESRLKKAESEKKTPKQLLDDRIAEIEQDISRIESTPIRETRETVDYFGNPITIPIKKERIAESQQKRNAYLAKQRAELSTLQKQRDELPDADKEAPFLDAEAARSGLARIGEQVAPAATEVAAPEIPELPTYLAGLIARDMAPDVNRMRVERSFGKREAEQAPSTKPQGSELEQVEKAKAYAKEQGWDWNAVAEQVRKQLGLDEDFLKPDSTEANTLAFIRKEDEKTAEGQKRTDAMMKQIAAEAEAKRLEKEQADAEAAAKEKAIRDEEAAKRKASSDREDERLRGFLKSEAYGIYAALKTKKEKEAFLNNFALRSNSRDDKRMRRILENPPISPDGNIATPPTEEAAPVAKTADEPAIATAADAVDSEKPTSQGKPEKPSQTITGSNAQTGAEMPVQSPTGEAIQRDATKPEQMTRDSSEPSQQTPEEYADVYGKGYPGTKARDLARDPKTLTARLRDALKFHQINGRDNWKLDAAKLQLVSPDGESAIRYKIRENPTEPTSYENQQTSRGTYDFVDPKSPLNGDELGLKPDLQERHESRIASAIEKQMPVSAAAVDAYGIALPSGYEKQGELYVFIGNKSEAKPAESNEKPSQVTGTAQKSAKAPTKARALAAVGRFASRDKERPVLNFIRDDGKTLVASDGKRLIQVDFAGDGTVDAPVYHKGHGRVKGEMGDRRYPNFKAVIPADGDLTTELDVDITRLSDLIERAKGVWKNHKDHGITLVGDASGNIGLVASTGDESFSDGFDADSSYIIGSFDAGFIGDILDSAADFGHSSLTLKFRDVTYPATLEAKGFQAVIMGQRTGVDERDFGHRQPPKNRQKQPSPSSKAEPETIPVTIHSVSGKSSTDMTGEQIQTALRDNKFLESALKSLIDCLK